MQPVDVREGASPLILAIPHAGVGVPETLRRRLNENGRRLRDTDWHVDRLYDGLAPDATMVRARFHRYVIDANRDPAGASLYPGQNTTGLCPVTDFDGMAIWHEGETPDTDEIVERLDTYHGPYHAALKAQIDRIKHRYGIAVLYDCHSIRSEIPYLFDGILPDLNLGTNQGATCASRFETAAAAICRRANDYTNVVNGRFRGGWTTRHYGRPERNVHALQMELTQKSYLETEASPFAYHKAKATRLRAHLRELLGQLEALALEGRTDTGRSP